MTNNELDQTGKRCKQLYLILAGLALSVLILLGLVCYIIRQNNRLSGQLDTQIQGLETDLAERFEKQAAFIAQERMFIMADIDMKKDQLEQTVNSGVARTIRSIFDVNYRVQQVEQIYADLLEEQQKKTLESLYDEEVLIQKSDEAAALFAKGQYRSANALYVVITEEQPENQDAWFYRWYSLFLSNKNDRAQYRQIREGLTLLERNGYTRPELLEVLVYITLEESGRMEGVGQ
jgi:uncharacterized protein YoxC